MTTAALLSAGAVPVRDQIVVTKQQAADLLGGVSIDWLEKHVLPYVKTIRPSRSVLIPTSELLRWVDENAAQAIE
jgi:hypothetical protein